MEHSSRTHFLLTGLALALILSPISFAEKVLSDAGQCLKSYKGCSEINIDNRDAEKAYKAGCDAKDFYSCSRLGQYYEVKAKDQKRALSFYDIACTGKDKYGCDGAYEMYMDLCYLQNQMLYCNKKDPKGEFRILAFLKTFNPKYQDAFVNHDFESSWAHRETESLYQSSLKSKNQKLLNGLLLAKKKGHHDGADAEGLQSDIWKFQGDKRGVKEVDE